ncbi:glycine betaine ABC transporter substrate-binding protein [Spirulina sp. CS-785/01]|uniref:glycine betaine ABC transporter substrate-binding protein n=1 Tax=Spirulina sp. CS-785/01 TaxID=3021716 RepID=UPI00232C5110|nr:glycine betaine ABC transporter substrate-binding protein [Spirulina sp. CS-785/01]MDB9312709.1 glycine betaine ABC transporter substrate-binding protein [Spirulina sp. CS-785/01]
MRRSRRWLLSALLTLFTLFLTVSCSLGSNDTAAIRVGSKDFAEQLIIGEMYALILEDHGYTVERKLNLGGTSVAQTRLEKGEIDLYPEYTGTALISVLKLPVSSDQAKVYQTVSKGYKEQFNLVWLNPSPMNNTQTLVMTPEESEQLGIETISDLVAQDNQIIMIGPPEFQEREDGLPGLEEAYGEFDLQQYIPVEPSLRYQGLIEGEANVAVGFSTDGEISAFNLVMLEDDKQLFPPYQVAPVVRQETLENYPKIRKLLNPVTTRLTNETMQRLNYEVTGKQRDPVEVANEFLQSEGLLE